MLLTGTDQRVSSIPATVDEHRQVILHAEQLATLRRRITTSEAHVAALMAERAAAERARHEASVAEALGDGAFMPPSPAAANLARLTADIEQARSEQAALRDALQRLTVIAAGVKKQVAQEVAGEVAKAARQRLEAMLPLVQKLAALNAEMLQLAAREPELRIPAAGFLEMWIAQAHACGLEDDVQ